MKHNRQHKTKGLVMTTPLYIFDLDGTIALIDHRRHFVEGDGAKNWRAFFDACDQDAPNVNVIKIMECFDICGADILIWSGRDESVREKTLNWFSQNTSFDVGYVDRILKMRPVGCYMADEELKARWLMALKQSDRGRIIGVFDDRQKVVDMWRRNGLTCFQVAPGDF
jgi:hypothetical protein